MIDPQKLNAAQSLVETLGALTNSTPEVIRQVKEAIPVMVSNVQSGRSQANLFTGLLNASVSNVDGHIQVHVIATMRGGRSRSGSIDLS